MKKPQQYLFVLYSKKGVMQRTFYDRADACSIAFDPRFTEKMVVRTYKLLKRCEEPKGVPVKCWREE